MTVTTHPLVEAILQRYADALADDAIVYRNHVLRGMNYHILLQGSPISDQAVLAWTVHDLGIWTERTFDYLQPSAALIGDLATEFGIADPERATTMVLEHHRLRHCADTETDAFRRADLIDVSRGVIRNGLQRSQVQAVVAELPYLGFHRWLVTGLSRYTLHHPARPVPMLRW